MSAKIISIMLAVILCTLCFAGCGGKTPEITESPAPETTVAPVPESTPEPESTPNDSSSINVGDIEIYENISEFINETFSHNNRTYGAIYDDGSLEDPSYPRERVFVIRSQEDFDQIFTQAIDGTPIDYQSETYVLYTFTTVYHREFIIKSASVVDQELTVQFRLKSPNDPDENGDLPPEAVGDAARPFQRFVLIKVNEIDINSANFTEID